MKKGVTSQKAAASKPEQAAEGVVDRGFGEAEAAVSGPVLTMQRQLAKAMQVSDKTVCLWVRRPDWPVGRKPPWTVVDLDNIRKWRAVLQEDRSGTPLFEASPATGLGSSAGQEPPSNFAQVRLEKELEGMLLTRVKRELLEGKYVERKLLDEALLGLTRVFVGELENIERALPLQVAGKDPGQVEKIIRDRFAASRSRLADQRTLELQKIEQTIKNQEQARRRGRPPAGAA